MLNWGNQFNICCFLDNNNYSSPYHQYETLLAAEAVASVKLNAGNAFAGLQQFHDIHQDWLFGHLAYDLKNETAPLQSTNFDGIGFPDLYFFKPRIVMLLKGDGVQIGGEAFTKAQAEVVYQECLSMPVGVIPPQSGLPLPPLQSRIHQQQYLASVQALQEHIHLGDCYEVNFCRENYMEGVTANPLALFNRLNALSPAPFAAYYRLEDKYLVCSSPERFLQKTGSRLLSQPIKGTSKKSADPVIDEQYRQDLYTSAKERAENIMIVDLVRNDLSYTAVPGSVTVAELCGIYTFAHVHHMISTVTATLNKEVPFTEVLRHTFPMGSMTGAPKLRVMELIERYEQTKRGLFSGAVGYVTPAGDFDFNVVIRSILYNSSQQYLSFQTGSAITFQSEPQKEWEECLLKAEGMKKAMSYEL
jgi:para-aminobenzoate synthetase component 1